MTQVPEQPMFPEWQNPLSKAARRGVRFAVTSALLSCAIGFVPASAFADAGDGVPAEAAMAPTVQRDGKVAVVTTTPDGVRRYAIKAAPARDFSMRIGQTSRPIADPCGDAFTPR